MPVAFRELGGSPVEEYSLEGFRARREFLIAWEDRDAFAGEVLGVAGGHGGRLWVQYPGKPSVFAVRLRYTPVDPEGPDRQPLAGLAEGLNAYSQSLARATVEYRTINSRDRDDGPPTELGTHLTYRMVAAAELEPLVPQGWRWADDPELVPPAGMAVNKRVPTTEHHLTWHQVVNPPWAAIRQLQGTVNEWEFLGCPAGTVLFEGAEANKLYRAGLEAGPSAFCWQIHYLFRERCVKHAGQAFGWNHFYRDDPPGWVELIHGAAGVYDRADFAPLFRSA
jgi:hypothetical protein